MNINVHTKRRMKLKKCRIFKSRFSIMNDKNRQKFAQCTFHSLQLLWFGSFNGSGKQKACIAGRNCSAGISVFELPRLFV